MARYASARRVGPVDSEQAVLRQIRATVCRMPEAGTPCQTASSWVLQTFALYERALASGDTKLVDRCLDRYAEDTDLTGSLMGISVRTHGREELRAAIISSIRAGTRHRHLELEVVTDDPDRIVVRGTFVSLVGDTPLIAVPAEWDVRLRDGLISTMRVIELDPARPAWTPLGPIPGFAGEVVASWGDNGLLARLDDGRAQELPTPDELSDQWEVGDPVLVFFDGRDVLGWYLPLRLIGVDLRTHAGDV